MIYLNSDTEIRIKEAAIDSGLSIQSFLDMLVDRHLTEKLDIEYADQTLRQICERFLDDLKLQYD